MTGVHDLSSQLQPVVRWRFEQLRGAGFDEFLALRIADDERWDLHGLIELRSRGCSPELAARILAPIDIGDAELP
jgi:hypothetical protein